MTPSTGRTGQPTALAAAVAVALLAAAVALPASALVGSLLDDPATTDRTLVVADADTDERLLAVPVDDGEEVTLAYTHSVEKTPVRDVYVVDGASLRMDRTVFRSFGAGLPTDGPIERTDEGFVRRVNDTYETLRVVPGTIAGHELVVGDDRYDLVEAADGPVVVFVSDRTGSDAGPAGHDDP